MYAHVRLVRTGLVVDLDPNASVPKSFSVAIDDDYSESWIEGADVYHNPRAKIPLDPEMIPGAAHHRLLSDGTVDLIARMAAVDLANEHRDRRDRPNERRLTHGFAGTLRTSPKPQEQVPGRGPIRPGSAYLAYLTSVFEVFYRAH